MNCQFTGHVGNPNPEGLFVRVAKRFLSYARHCSYTNLDWDTKLSKRSSFSIMGLRAAADNIWPPPTDKVAAMLNGACELLV